MSQTERITKYLLSGKKITALKALKLFNCFRLSARIQTIKQNYKVTVDMVKTKTGKRIAEYKILI